MRDVLRLSVPIGLWLAGFSAMYALQAFTCSRHWPEGLADRPVLLGAWVLAAVLQAALVLLLVRDPSPSPFVRVVSLSLGITAVVATVWTLAPVAATSTCL